VKKKLNVIMFVSIFSLALLGGVLYFPLFEFWLSIDEGFIPMAPSTSVLFLVTIAVSLTWINATRKFYRYKTSVAPILLMVALFGLLEIVEHFTGVELNFESYFSPDLGSFEGIPLARMSPVTGLCFLLTAGVLLIILNQKKQSEMSYFINLIKNTFTTLLSLISLLFIVTYLYKSPLFYNTEDIIPMALSTSLGFLSVSGILIINDKQSYLMKVFTNLSPSTALIRFITPFTVLSVLVTGLAQHFMFTANSVDSANIVNNSIFLSTAILILFAVVCGFMAMLVTKTLMCFQDESNKNLHQYKSMVTLSSGMQALLDDNFVYLAVNQAYVEKLNLTIDQVVGKHLSDIFGKVYFDSEFISFAERTLAGEVVIQKKWVNFSAEHKLFIEVEMSPYYQDDGKIYGIMVNARDITQLKQYQDNLEKSKRVIENSPVIAFRWKPDYLVEHVSSNVELLGFQASDLLSGKVKYVDMVHSQDLPHVMKEVEYFTEKEIKNFTQEYRIVSPLGKVFWVDDRTIIERGEDGSVSFYQGIIIDITEKKQAELKLKQSNTIIHNVINSTPDLIFAKNTDHQYILANNAFAQSLKQSSQLLIGKTDQELNFTDEKINKFRTQDQDVLNGKRVVTPSCRALNDNSKVIETSKFPLRKENGDIAGVIGIGHDVTEHIANLAKISKQQKELSQTLNAILDAVITIDDLGLIQSCNRATEQMFGYSTEELVGKNVSLLMPKNVATKHDAYIKNHLLTGENKIIGKGRELIGKNKNQKTFPLHLTIAELPKNDDKRKRFVGVCHDLSRMKQHEKLLNRTQKMEALGQLTGGIAHDYNNVLGVIIGYSDILKVQLKDQPALLDFVEQIHQAGNRGAQLTRKLLSFSRQTPDSSQESDINSIIKNNIDVLRKTLLSVELRLNLDETIDKINIDRNSFEDALLNMAINAMHAMPKGGMLTLSTCEVALSKEQAISFNIHQGGYVQLSIEDNGVGMSKAIQDKIFEPFFSTKGDQGSGLGLAQVYGFMKSSLGAINVYSELGAGTRFSLYFPLAQEEYKENNVEESKEKNERDTKEKLSKQGNESILVVDDEPQLRTLAQTILMAQGYRVLTASNGVEALAVLEKNSIDLMFSDIIMPQMNGYRLVEQAQKLYPKLKIILASGFQGNQADNRITLDEAIIEKPYQNNYLLSRVRECLDKHESSNALYPYLDSNLVSRQSAKNPTMKKMLWTNEMSIDDGGVLDEDHKLLCILFNRCQDLLETENSQQPLREVITELVQYIQDHFAREELWMKKSNYPYAKNHSEVHHIITKQLIEKLVTCSEKDILLWLSTEMSVWLVDHIMEMDKPLHKYIMKNKAQTESNLKGNIEDYIYDQ
jgi:PAS domain S-box-containing protein/hemerythrin-like metal-binding protein